MIAIVDYGLGNVAAIETIYKRLNLDARLVSCPDELARATKIVLPGVGAFDWAMSRLNESGMRSALDGQVQNGVPVLGICVGMQMMAQRSEEGQLNGLGWIEGEVRKFTQEHTTSDVQLPHMGWNDVEGVNDDALFRDLTPARFYFLHSYCFVPRHDENVIGVSEYGSRFVCSVRRANVVGVQFHPEKSHGWGVQLLKNFAEV